MRATKQVTVGGLTWNVESRNERTTEYGGRYFFAVRCNPKRPWMIHEMDSDLAQTGSAKPLRVFHYRYLTGDLSTTVKEICGVYDDDARHCCGKCYTVFPLANAQCPECGEHRGDAHPSLPFEKYRATMKARHAA